MGGDECDARSAKCEVVLCVASVDVMLVVPGISMMGSRQRHFGGSRSSIGELSSGRAALSECLGDALRLREDGRMQQGRGEVEELEEDEDEREDEHGGDDDKCGVAGMTIDLGEVQIDIQY
ncbi:hypothetical protein EDB81DRAFT_764409 [Dactylonectria macrodidyma]|uniref:Uncharacterized protein n=1 Tax=Dactylonectria macrodidyma TaxID=307937 RepID=A0A9P9E1Y4_9HYPO|nr:hypothetical protein EDB81DRAFT_764409 [Dactylonectria macrodidyma]